MDYSGCRKTHRFPPPYGLGSHSLTHRPTENPTGMTKEMTAPHPSPPRAGEGAITLHNLFNYATLNQLCIQAHSSSLRCGGSLCKVQCDQKRKSSLRPPSRSPLQVQKVLKLFSPLQSVRQCDPESSSG